MPTTWSAHADLPVSAEQAWAVLVDLEAYPVWNPFTRAMDGLLTPGERLRMTVDMGWITVTQTETVRVVEAPARLTWALDHLPTWLLWARREQRITRTGPATCRYHTDDTIGGALLPAVRLLFGASLTRGFAAMATALAAEAARRHHPS